MWLRFHRIFFFALILITSSCHQDSDGTDEKMVFTYNESNGITSLDPAFARNLENMWAVNQLFDGLVALDEHLEIQPSIAESWEVSADGLTYTFHLRSNINFHSSSLFEGGTRSVNAQDVLFSFNRILDAKTASPGKWIFDPLRSEDPIEIVDETTLRLHLTKPFPPFLGMLCTQYANIVPPEVVEHFGNDFRANPIGTGPFKFAFWMEDVALVFHKNEHFWERDEEGNSLPYLDAVKIEFVRDMSAEYLGLLQGKYDFMSGLHSSFKDELLLPTGELREAFNDKIRFQRVPFIKTDYIGILVDDSAAILEGHPLKNKLVRQALNYSVDRKSMVRYLRNNSVYEASHGFVPKGLPAFNEAADYGVHFDVSKAKELLAEAGYPNGEGMPAIPLSTTSDYVDLCEFLQFQWAQIGVKVEIDVLASSSHREKVAKSQALLFRKSWLADYPDAENFLMLFYSQNFCPGGPNYTHYANQTFDSLYDTASLATPERRQALYQSMDSLIMQDAPVIPLFYDQVSHFVRKEVLDFETNGVNMLELKRTKK